MINFIIGLIVGSVVGYAMACMMMAAAKGERKLEK